MDRTRNLRKAFKYVGRVAQIPERGSVTRSMPEKQWDPQFSWLSSHLKLLWVTESAPLPGIASLVAQRSPILFGDQRFPKVVRLGGLPTL
jgi:hypothetical protein